MEIVVNSLICVYGILTIIAGMVQWKEKGFTIRSLLFIIVSLGMVASLFMTSWALTILVVCFLSLHVLAMWEGLQTRGQIRYNHHFFRFIFHMLIVLGVIW